MKKSTFTLLPLIAIFFTGAILLNSCSKDDSIATNSVAAAHINAGGPSVPPATGLFNRDLIVIYAQDDNTNITADFDGISFRFAGSMEAQTGEAYAMTRWIAVQGNWTGEQSGGNNFITVAIPTDLIPVVSFVNRKWIVTNNGNAVTLVDANGQSDRLTLSAGPK